MKKTYNNPEMEVVEILFSDSRDYRPRIKNKKNNFSF